MLVIANAAEVSDFVISNGSLSKYEGTDEIVVIPSDLGITIIHPNAFARNKTLKSVIIPEGVEIIMALAFSECSALSTITLPDSIKRIDAGAFSGTSWYNQQPDGPLYLGKCLMEYKNPWKMPSDINISVKEGTIFIADHAFWYCKGLIGVTIPASVNSIGYNVFGECTSLVEITVEETNQNYSSIEGVLFDKVGKTLIHYPAAKIESTYNIPSSTEIISGGPWGGRRGGNPISVFENNPYLKNLTIPASVKKMDKGTIRNCTALEQISVDSKNDFLTSLDGILFNKSGIELLKYPSGNKAISYTVPRSVETIESLAFDVCTNLKSIVIPDGVKNIGNLVLSGWGAGAFEGCSSLESITLPNSVISIGEWSFERCSSLSSVILPNSITSIPGWMFTNCTSLKAISLPININSILYNSFENCTSLESVTIPATNVSIDSRAFTGSKSVKLYGLLGSNTEIFAKANNFPFEPISIIKDANRTASSVVVNGSPVTFEAYNIESNNYFKLRDIAQVLSGSAKQFEVGWDSANNAIGLTTGKSYTLVGGELVASFNTQSKKAALSSSRVYLNGQAVNLTAYNIDGNNYFKLRDLGAAINFGVEWNNTTSSIGIDTNKVYVE